MKPEIIVAIDTSVYKGDDINEHNGLTSIPKDAYYIIVGRPITQSTNPVDAYHRYVDAIMEI